MQDKTTDLLAKIDACNDEKERLVQQAREASNTLCEYGMATRVLADRRFVELITVISVGRQAADAASMKDRLEKDKDKFRTEVSPVTPPGEDEARVALRLQVL